MEDYVPRVRVKVQTVHLEVSCLQIMLKCSRNIFHGSVLQELEIDLQEFSDEERISSFKSKNNHVKVITLDLDEFVSDPTSAAVNHPGSGKGIEHYLLNFCQHYLRREGS